MGSYFTRVSWPGYSHPTAGSVGCQWDHTSPELAGRIILTLRQSSCSAGSVLLKWNRAALWLAGLVILSLWQDIY